MSGGKNVKIMNTAVKNENEHLILYAYDSN